MSEDPELLDYDDADDGNQQGNATKSAKTDDNGNATGKSNATAPIRGSYVSIHASGFKDFLLKPELLRAIMDCGFEHPSEGKTILHLPMT